MATAMTGFSRGLFRFLKDLAQNNDRDWFHDNTERFRNDVLGPCVSFVERLGRMLPKLSQRIVADARPAGGSILRNQRDARFVRGDGPYYPSMRMAFRHERADIAIAPALLVHLEPGASHLAVGLERPDTGAARRVRARIVAEAQDWMRIARSSTHKKNFLLDDARLQRVPAEWADTVPPDHPLAAELRRRWFIARRPLADDDVLQSNFAQAAGRSFRTTLPLLKFLAEALGVEL